MTQDNIFTEATRNSEKGNVLSARNCVLQHALLGYSSLRAMDMSHYVQYYLLLGGHIFLIVKYTQAYKQTLKAS
jgi:hypothetical protein